MKQLIVLILLILAGCSESSVYDGNHPAGTFEVKIGQDTVLTNGLDIVDVDPDNQSGVLEGLCMNKDDEYHCPYILDLVISDKAARRNAQITDRLDVVDDHLSENLSIFLNGEKLSELQISPELKGKASKDLLITGSGKGKTIEEAMQDAKTEYDELYDVLFS